MYQLKLRNNYQLIIKILKRKDTEIYWKKRIMEDYFFCFEKRIKKLKGRCCKNQNNKKIFGNIGLNLG